MFWCVHGFFQQAAGFVRTDSDYPPMPKCQDAFKSQLRHELKRCLCRYRLLSQNRRRTLSWTC